MLTFMEKGENMPYYDPRDDVRFSDLEDCQRKMIDITRSLVIE